MLQYSSPASSRLKGSPSVSKDVASLEAMRFISSLPQMDNVKRLMEKSTGSGMFEVFGDDAVWLANLLHQTHAIGSTGIHAIPTLVLNPSQFQNMARSIVFEYGCKLEIYKYESGRRTWKLAISASPGNTEFLEMFLEDSFGDGVATERADVASYDSTGSSSKAGLTSMIAAIIVGMENGAGAYKIGMAFADVSSYRMGLIEFVDNDLMSNVETVLIQLGVKECIYPAYSTNALSSEYSKLHDLLVGCEIVTSPVKMSEFESADIYQDLTRLLLPSDQSHCSNQTNFGIPTEAFYSLKAASALVNYLQLLSFDSNLGAFQLIKHEMGEYMRLDDVALRSLNLFPGNVGNAGSSLFGILNHCKTRQGARLLNQWIRQPLLDPAAIEQRLDIVEAFFTNHATRQLLREQVLRSVPDLGKTIKKLVRNKATLQDLVLIYQVVVKLPVILEELGKLDCPSLSSLLVTPLLEIRDELYKYGGLIENTVDFNALERHEYLVRADFDPQLQEISQQRDSIVNDQIGPEFSRVARQARLEKHKKIKLERNSIYGFFVRVSRLDWGSIEREDFFQLSAQKNGVYFTTSELKEQSQKYDELGNLYTEQQAILVKEMQTIAATYRHLFDLMNSYIGMLDVWLSLAYAATIAPIPYTRPIIINDTDNNACRHMLLKESRHVCLESQSTFIPNNVEFWEADDDCRRGPLQIITGPNMGGKSTYIRQTAIIAIMAQMGSFVPAAEALVPIFDAVMVRVGAGDNILRGVSTFMVEMIETTSIVRTATKKSLVIIDELGRGTSTSEGLGIAWAVSKYIATKVGCFTFFATHFHELTRLASTYPRLISNLHVLAQLIPSSTTGGAQFTLMYNVKEGPCEESFGIEVARMAHFPTALIEMARSRLAELEKRPYLPMGGKDQMANYEPDNTIQFLEQTISTMSQMTQNNRQQSIRDMADDPAIPLFVRDLIYSV